jgi:hypothetical protein
LMCIGPGWWTSMMTFSGSTPKANAGRGTRPPTGTWAPLHTRGTSVE